MPVRQLFIVVAFLLLASGASGQQLNREQVAAQLEKDGCVIFKESKVRLCKADYIFEGDLIGAITYQPLTKLKSPGILMIPGYLGKAQNYINLGTILARNGFAVLSVDHPGFGKSKAKPDFVGPQTIKALNLGFKKLQRESYVDKNNLGIFGYSRGGMAASLMAVRRDDVKAVVLGGGVYDFKKAYDEVKIEGIRSNMKAETGMTDKAIKERSSVLRMKKLRAPVLILHNAEDENVSVSQAYLLRDRLTELQKDFEIRISPVGGHGAMDAEFVPTIVSFFSRRLMGVRAEAKVK